MDTLHQYSSSRANYFKCHPNVSDFILTLKFVVEQKTPVLQWRCGKALGVVRSSCLKTIAAEGLRGGLGRCKYAICRCERLST
jgi:hypothetical protein